MMAMEKEFNYAESSQRRWVLASLFFSTVTLTFCASDLSIVLSHYFQYGNVIRIIMISLLSGLFAGNMLARFIFSRIGSSRIPHGIITLLFVASAVFYITRYQFFTLYDEPLMKVFFIAEYLIPLFIAFLGMFAGMLYAYYLRLSCGEYLDERHGILSFFFIFCIGIFIGLILPGVRFFTGFPGAWKQFIFFMILPLALLPGIFIINLRYTPASFIAKNFADEAETEEEQDAHREEMFFTYLNTAYIVIYVYLAGQLYLKFFGTSIPLKLIFIALVFGGFLPGMIAGRLFRNAIWPVYTQMLFPLSFFMFVFLVLYTGGTVSFMWTVLLTLIPLFIFGFALYRTMAMIADNFTQNRRFRILDLSFFILPVPLVTALTIIPFTNLLYFVFLYLVATLNIIVPVVFLYNKKINPVKKFLFFMASLLFIPAVLFIHFSLNFPLNGEYFVQRVKGYDAVQKTNYNQNYIGGHALVYMDRVPVFRLNDSRIRNLKRAVIPMALYTYREGSSDKVLLIDGNQRFFRNPLYRLLPSPSILDPLSDGDVNYNRLPVSGSRDYIVEEKDMLRFFRNDGRTYRTIADIPNIRDQINYYFHFTDEFYRMAKEHLATDGIFIQVFSLKDVRPEFLYSASQGMKKNFRNSICYLFYDIMILLSSDAEDAFVITPPRYNYVKSILENNAETTGLFYNDLHFFSHLLFVEIDDLLAFLEKDRPDSLYLLRKRKIFLPANEYFDNFTTGNSKILPFVSREGTGIYVYQGMLNRLAGEQQILTVLKKTEISEADERYEEETGFLFSLRPLANYRPELAAYLQYMLNYKEEHYGIAARAYEKEKHWDDAVKLYRAILTINPDNFDANYRMGFLSIILQDLDNSFKYLSNAMKLKPGDPKVLYQMGVLLFSKGDYTGAINYLNQSIQQKEDSASVYLYLGLAHEELGHLTEAEAFYKTALLKDPNDPTIKSRLDGLVEMKTGVPVPMSGVPMKNQVEDEQGEALPLPVNKSAYDVRIGDKQAEEQGGLIPIPIPLPEPQAEVKPQQEAAQ